MDKKNVWFITAKTNLHVGNENTSSYGLIDLAVQRNATTGLPCINSSSLKGALNEYAASKENWDDQQLIEVFGNDKKGRNRETKKGKYTFFDANILFLPVQDNKMIYRMATSRQVLKRFKEQIALFGINVDEDDDAFSQKLFSFLGVEDRVEPIDDGSDAEFIDRCSDLNLPIIARNVLDNGESKNLWYEQVIPAETIFYTIIDDNIIDDNNGISLADILQDAIVQIGANATIGYGYCKFTNMSNFGDEQDKK